MIRLHVPKERLRNWGPMEKSDLGIVVTGV